jgi:hypothetical protein
MIFIKFTVGLFVALISLNSTAHAISFDEARHLLARTGFGVADPARIRALQPLSFEAAVDQLLGQVRTLFHCARPASEHVAGGRGKKRRCAKRNAVKMDAPLHPGGSVRWSPRILL